MSITPKIFIRLKNMSANVVEKNKALILCPYMFKSCGFRNNLRKVSDFAILITLHVGRSSKFQAL
jgi:hypothetical protein